MLCNFSNDFQYFSKYLSKFRWCVSVYCLLFTVYCFLFTLYRFCLFNFDWEIKAYQWNLPQSVITLLKQRSCWILDGFFQSFGENNHVKDTLTANNYSKLLYFYTTKFIPLIPRFRQYFDIDSYIMSKLKLFLVFLEGLKNKHKWWGLSHYIHQHSLLRWKMFRHKEILKSLSKSLSTFVIPNNINESFIFSDKKFVYIQIILIQEWLFLIITFWKILLKIEPKSLK